jgi:hypothetical protein
MHKNIKILINSYPRSGTTNLAFALRASLRGFRPMDEEELFQNDSWIIKSHLPGALLGAYPEGISVITILRNPIDAISSNCYRWSNGHTGNVLQGRVVIDKGQVRTDSTLDDELKQLIDHEINQYIAYLHCYLSSKNILAFRYEDTQNSISKCLDIIFPGILGLDYAAAEDSIENPVSPSQEKNTRYHAIREYVSTRDSYLVAVDMYSQALKLRGKALSV